MDFKNAFVDGGIVFLLAFFLCAVVCSIADRQRTGEWDWKTFGRSTIYALVLGIVAFLRAIITGNPLF